MMYELRLSDAKLLVTELDRAGAGAETFPAGGYPKIAETWHFWWIVVSNTSLRNS